MSRPGKHIVFRHPFQPPIGYLQVFVYLLDILEGFFEVHVLLEDSGGEGLFLFNRLSEKFFFLQQFLLFPQPDNRGLETNPELLGVHRFPYHIVRPEIHGIIEPPLNRGHEHNLEGLVEGFFPYPFQQFQGGGALYIEVDQKNIHGFSLEKGKYRLAAHGLVYSASQIEEAAFHRVQLVRITIRDDDMIILHTATPGKGSRESGRNR